MEESHSARLLRQIKEIAEIAGIRTEEAARVTKKRLDVLSLSRELSREKAALGDRVYELSRRPDHGDILGDVTVQAVLGRILNLEGSLADCEEEIGNIRASAQERASDVRRRADEPVAPFPDADGARVAEAAGESGAAETTTATAPEKPE